LIDIDGYGQTLACVLMCTMSYEAERLRL